MENFAKGMMEFFWEHIIYHDKCRYEEYYAKTINGLPLGIDNIEEKATELALFINRFSQQVIVETTPDMLPKTGRPRATSTEIRLVSKENTSQKSDVLAVAAIAYPEYLEMYLHKMRNDKYFYAALQKLLQVYENKNTKNVISELHHIRPQSLMDKALEAFYKLPNEVFTIIAQQLSSVKLPKKGQDIDQYISYKHHLMLWALKHFFNINPDKTTRSKKLTADKVVTGISIVAKVEQMSYDSVRKNLYRNKTPMYHLYEFDKFSHVCKRLGIDYKPTT